MNLGSNYQNTSNFSSYQPFKKQEKEEAKQDFSTTISDTDNTIKEEGATLDIPPTLLDEQLFDSYVIKKSTEFHKEVMSNFTEQYNSTYTNLDYQNAKEKVLSHMNAILNDTTLNLDVKIREELVRAKETFELSSLEYNNNYESINGLAKRLVALDANNETQKEDYLNTANEISNGLARLTVDRQIIAKNANVFFGLVSDRLPKTQKNSIMESVAKLGEPFSVGARTFILENGLTLAGMSTDWTICSTNNFDSIVNTVKNTLENGLLNVLARGTGLDKEAQTTPTQKIAEQTADSLVKEMLQNPKTNETKETKETKTSEVKV